MANSFPASGLAYADAFSVGNASSVNSSLYVCSSCVQAVRIEHNYDQTNLHHNTLWLRANNNGAQEAASIGFTVVNGGGDHHRANIAATGNAGQIGGNLALYTRNNNGNDQLGYFQDHAGNVGIGTTDFTNVAFGSPAIHAAGNRATLGLSSTGTLSTIAFTAGNCSQTALHINHSDEGTTSFYNYRYGGQAFVFTGLGRLGVNTTSPNTPLQIRSNTIDSGGAGLSVFGFDGAAEFTTTRAESPANAAIYLYNRPTSGTNGTGTGISFRASSTNTADRPQGGFYSSWTDSTDATRTSKFFFDLVNSGTYATRMTLLGNGNLGLGTTSPSSRLHVAGDVGIGTCVNSNTYTGPSQYGAITFPRAQLLFSNTNAQAQFYFISNGTLNASSQFTYTCNGRAGKINIDDGGIALDVASCGTNGCVISWTTGIQINNSGNVGIGTTSPASRLHITHTGAQGACTIILQSTDSCGNGTISWRTSAGVTQAQIGSNYNVGDNSGNLELITSGNTRLLVTSGGLVSINQTSGYGVFNVTGINCAWGEGIVLNPAPNGYSAINFRAEGRTGSCFIATWQLGKISSGETSSGEAFSLNRAGLTGGTAYRADASQQWKTNGDSIFGFSVGIGTTTPSYRLHVNGTFYAAGSSIKYKEGICNYNTDSCLFMCLKPVTYQYKDEFKHLGKELKSDIQIGLIAEHVAEVMPELAVLVNEEDEKVVRNVDYEKLSIVLLAEVQKLRKEVDELKK